MFNILSSILALILAGAIALAVTYHAGGSVSSIKIQKDTDGILSNAIYLKKGILSAKDLNDPILDEINSTPSTLIFSKLVSAGYISGGVEGWTIFKSDEGATVIKRVVSSEICDNLVARYGSPYNLCDQSSNNLIISIY